LRLPYTLRWIGKVIFREADLSVYVRRPQTHRSGVYQTKKNYQEKNVIRKLFRVLKIVISGVILAQLSNTPRAIKNGLIVVYG
jgi:hypothetical protein